MKEDSSLDTFTPDNSILALSPRNPRHRILLRTPEPDLLQELYQVLGGLLWWPAPYSLHGFRRWALWIGSAVSPQHGPGLTRDHGPRNLHLLHGLGQVWVREGRTCPRSPGALPRMSSVGACRGSPRPPHKLEETLQTSSSSPWEWGPAPMDMGTHLADLECALCDPSSLPFLPQEKHTAWAGLNMGGWASGRVPRRRAYPPSSPGCLPSPQWLVGPLWGMP